MKLLPIWWTETPTPEDWKRLSASRERIGYTDMVKPARALQGSPGTLLVIGPGRPDWVQNFYACNDITDNAELDWALAGALQEDERVESFAELLSLWMDADVKMTGEEEHDAGVRFE